MVEKVIKSDSIDDSKEELKSKSIKPENGREEQTSQQITNDDAFELDVDELFELFGIPDDVPDPVRIVDDAIDTSEENFDENAENFMQSEEADEKVSDEELDETTYEDESQEEPHTDLKIESGVEGSPFEENTDYTVVYEENTEDTECFDQAEEAYDEYEDLEESPSDIWVDSDLEENSFEDETVLQEVFEESADVSADENIDFFEKYDDNTEKEVTEYEELSDVTISDTFQNVDNSALESIAEPDEDALFFENDDSNQIALTADENAEMVQNELHANEIEPASPPKKKSKVISIVSNVLFYSAILVAFIAIINGSSANGSPRNFFGYYFFNVLSDSMQREIPIGSFVVVEKVDLNTIEVNDDITYFETKEKSVTHRVIEIYENYEGSGLRGFKTQGIENKNPDKEIVYSTNVVGKVVYSIPYLGAVLAFISDNFLLILIIFVLCMIISFALKGIFAKDPSEPKRVKKKDDSYDHYELVQDEEIIN